MSRRASPRGGLFSGLLAARRLEQAQLLELCFQVVSHPESAFQAWKQLLDSLHSIFSRALERVEKALSNERPDTLASTEFAQMIATVEEQRTPEVLDTGWVNIMSGLKVFKLAGDRLAAGQPETV